MDAINHDYNCNCTVDFSHHGFHSSTATVQVSCYYTVSYFLSSFFLSHFLFFSLFPSPRSLVLLKSKCHVTRAVTCIITQMLKLIKYIACFILRARGTNNGQVEDERSHTFSCTQDSFGTSQMNNPSIILATSSYSNDKMCPRNSCHRLIDHHCSDENSKHDHCDHVQRQREYPQHQQLHHHHHHHRVHASGNHSCGKTMHDNINCTVDACNHKRVVDTFSPAHYNARVDERTNNSRTNEQLTHSYHAHTDAHGHRYHVRRSPSPHHDNLYRSNSSEFVSQHLPTLPLTLATSASSKLGVCSFLISSLLLFFEPT